MKFSIPPQAPSVPCRSCRALVVWIITANQRRMPVEATGPHRGDSHFAHCPDAAKHRKPRT